MSLFDIVKAYRTPLTLVLIVFGPQIVKKLITSFSGSRSRSPRPSTPVRPSIPTRLKVFLALHTIYHLSHLLFPPYDLFSTPHLPILSPNDRLRARLIPPGSGSVVNPLLDLLLTRMKNLDDRLLYARYGHATLQGCLWCKTSLDYLIASLPDILARYVWSAILLCCLGSETLCGKSGSWRGKRWTNLGFWVLAIALVTEVGTRYLWDLRISHGDCLHLSHTIHLARTTLLMLIPLLHTFLPAGPPPPNSAALIASLQNSHNTQRLTSLLRESVQQDSALQATWAHVGYVERTVKAAARVDPDVQRTMREFGLGLDVNQGAGDGARRWVHDGWSGLMRIHIEGEVQ